MYSKIKRFFYEKNQSDKLKSDTENKINEIKNNLPKYSMKFQRKPDLQRQEDLITRIAKQQIVKNPLIDKIDNIKTDSIIRQQLNRNTVTRNKDNDYFDRIETGVERNVIAIGNETLKKPDYTMVFNSPLEHAEFKKERFDDVSYQMFKMLSPFDIDHLNDVPSYIPKAIPNEPVIKLNSKKLNNIKERMKHNIKNPFQYSMYKLKKIDISSNIFVWKNNISKIYNSFKSKFIIKPILKFNKHVERQMFLSNLKKEQRENLKDLKFEISNTNVSSALVALIIKKNFDLKSIKDSIEKQKNRQSEIKEIYKKRKQKSYAFKENNNNHLLFE